VAYMIKPKPNQNWCTYFYTKR